MWRTIASVNSAVTVVDIAASAQALARAEADLIGIEPLTEQYPSITVGDAYAIQSINIARRLAAGERLVGRKIGLTSQAIQQQLRVNEPDYGAITDAMQIANGGSIAAETLLAPRLEAEFAFEIDTDLPLSPGYDELVSAVSGVAVAIEVIDSRVADWRIKLADTVADNASMARVVWGEFVPATPELLAKLPATTISLMRDGEEVCAGPGSAVLGHPLTSLHWLAGVLGAQGDGFRAGDRVLAGAVAAAVPLTAGAQWVATAEGLPPVHLVSTTHA